MIVSLGEIDSTALLAARGAGYAWGLAEEAGKSARWLAARRMPWLSSLLAMLAVSPDEAELVVAGDSIRPRQAPNMSPLSVGAYIADARPLLPVTLHNVHHPIWLLPVAAALASEKRSPVAISWRDAVTGLAEQAVYQLGNPASLWVEAASQVRIERLPTTPSGPPSFVRQSGGSQVDPHAWRSLEDLAARTYVPATASSRLRGAGAGVLDAD